MTAQDNYQAALRHVSKLKELTHNELDELQDVIYSELARGRQYAYDNWYNDPAKRTGVDVIEDIDNMLKDPTYIRLLPSYYFEAEELLKAVQKRLTAILKASGTVIAVREFEDIFTPEAIKLKVPEQLLKQLIDADAIELDSKGQYQWIYNSRVKTAIVVPLQLLIEKGYTRERGKNRKDLRAWFLKFGQQFPEDYNRQKKYYYSLKTSRELDYFTEYIDRIK